MPKVQDLSALCALLLIHFGAFWLELHHFVSLRFFLG